MKKIAAISAAAAATLAMAPSAFAANQPVQTMDVKLTSSKAGTKSKPTVVGATFRTGTQLDPSDPNRAALHTITNAKITLPKGIKLDYKNFPTCTEQHAAGEAYTCETSAPKSKIGSGTAKAALSNQQAEPDGTLVPFVGSGGRLIIQTSFDQPAFIREGLIGKVSLSGGKYSFDIAVQPTLQQPLAGVYQQLLDFNLKFNKVYAKKGSKKIGLVQLTSCPKGGYEFKGEFKYLDGTSATVTDTVKCSSPKKK